MILQVTPVVAIAPLILIWVGFERINLALVLIAAIVAFFPILAGTTLGLKSRRLQPDRPDAAVWRLALADPVARAPALRPALSAVGHEDRRAAWR